MKKVLAITAAFILAAIVLAPVMGYTINSTSPGPYSIQSGESVNYSISSGMPAHELTTAPLQPIVPGPSVTIAPTQYSFTTAGPITNSFRLLGASNVQYNSLGMTAMPQAEVLGAPVTTEAPATSPVAQAPATPAVVISAETPAAQNITASATTAPEVTTPAPAVTPAPVETTAPAVTTNVTVPTNTTTNVTTPLNVTTNVTAPLNATKNV